MSQGEPGEPETFSIKGSSLRAKLEYAREAHGAPAEAELKEWLRSQGVVLVLASDWYPYEIYTGLNEAVAERLLGGKLSRLREVGLYSADRALDSVYRAYLDSGDFESFLRRLASLHQRFFNLGRMEVRVGRGSCEIVLTGAPAYPEPDMQIAAGFYVGAANRFGLPGVSCELRLSPDSASFLLRWRARS